MKKESKILIGVIAALLVALPLMAGVTAAAADDGQEFEESNDSPEQRLRRIIVARNQQKRRRAIWFFRGAVKVTVTGTVEQRDGNIMIVATDVEGDMINIVLPRRWLAKSDNSKVISLQQMFDEEYVKIGDEVTLKVLKRTVTNENEEVTVTAIFGYEIPSHSLYAILPYNIG